MDELLQCLKLMAMACESYKQALRQAQQEIERLKSQPPETPHAGSPTS